MYLNLHDTDLVTIMMQVDILYYRNLIKLTINIIIHKYFLHTLYVSIIVYLCTLIVNNIIMICINQSSKMQYFSVLTARHGTTLLKVIDLLLYLNSHTIYPTKKTFFFVKFKLKIIYKQVYMNIYWLLHYQVHKYIQ